MHVTSGNTKSNISYLEFDHPGGTATSVFQFNIIDKRVDARDFTTEALRSQSRITQLVLLKRVMESTLTE